MERGPVLAGDQGPNRSPPEVGQCVKQALGCDGNAGVREHATGVGEQDCHPKTDLGIIEDCSCHLEKESSVSALNRFQVVDRQNVLNLERAM